jgi:hypothetical protein
MAPLEDVETYCENGVWKSRWRNSPEPFATGGGKDRQISQGATVAQWYGTIAEHNSYCYLREHTATPS